MFKLCTVLETYQIQLFTLENACKFYFHAFQSFFDDEMAAQIEFTGVTPRGCLVRLDNQQSRYVQTSCAFPGQPSTVHYAHRLVYMLGRRWTSIPVYLDVVMGVSHLCHEPRCVRFDHLTLEPKEINGDRVHCKNQGVCTGTHLPACIL